MNVMQKYTFFGKSNQYILKLLCKILIFTSKMNYSMMLKDKKHNK